MTHNIHDATFKQILSHEQHFTDFCKAYLPDDVKGKIDWQTLKLYKLNQEFIDHIQDEQQKHIADVVYAVNYRDRADDRECLILVHSEHQSQPDKLLPLRLAHYKLAMLLDYARSHKGKPLPVVVSIAYYHGKITPYPHSMNIYDLFEDRELAEAHLLNPKLVDLKQLSISDLYEHSSISAMEAFMQLAFLDPVIEPQIDLLCEVLSQCKNNDTAMETLNIVLHYGTNVLKCNKDYFKATFLRKLPELEENMQTVAQQWKDEIEQQAAPKYRQEGRQEGRQELVIDMLNNGAAIDFIVKYSGLSHEEVEALKAKHNRSGDH